MFLSSYWFYINFACSYCVDLGPYLGPYLGIFPSGGAHGVQTLDEFRAPLGGGGGLYLGELIAWWGCSYGV